jgi:hypothetical protein
VRFICRGCHKGRIDLKSNLSSSVVMFITYTLVEMQSFNKTTVTFTNFMMN